MSIVAKHLTFTDEFVMWMKVMQYFQMKLLYFIGYKECIFKISHASFFNLSKHSLELEFSPPVKLAILHLNSTEHSEKGHQELNRGTTPQCTH